MPLNSLACRKGRHLCKQALCWYFSVMLIGAPVTSLAETATLVVSSFLHAISIFRYSLRWNFCLHSQLLYSSNCLTFFFSFRFNCVNIWSSHQPIHVPIRRRRKLSSWENSFLNFLCARFIDKYLSLHSRILTFYPFETSKKRGVKGRSREAVFKMKLSWLRSSIGELDLRKSDSTLISIMNAKLGETLSNKSSGCLTKYQLLSKQRVHFKQSRCRTMGDTRRRH